MARRSRTGSGKDGATLRPPCPFRELSCAFPRISPAPPLAESRPRTGHCLPTLVRHLVKQALAPTGLSDRAGRQETCSAAAAEKSPPRCIHAIRHIASTAELWFMSAGFSGYDAPASRKAPAAAPVAVECQNRTLLSPVYGAGRPRAAAIQGAETTMPVLFRTLSRCGVRRAPAGARTARRLPGWGSPRRGKSACSSRPPR